MSVSGCEPPSFFTQFDCEPKTQSARSKPVTPGRAFAILLGTNETSIGSPKNL